MRKGEWVELTDDEIAAAAGGATRLLEVDHFVPAGEIDPVFYERTYYLGAGDDGDEAYALLQAALERSGRAGVGQWVFHNRERTVIIRPLEDVLALHTMRFAADLVDPGGLKLSRVNRKPAAKEVRMAGRLVEGLHNGLRPDRLPGRAPARGPAAHQAQGVPRRPFIDGGGGYGGRVGR